MEFKYDLKIPKERVAVLIGKKGVVKKQLEEETKTKINVDSKEGDVVISGEDAMGLFNAREVIKAIARGFNPEIARQLLKGDLGLEIIPLKGMSRKSKAHAERLKGRVIGAEGKSRRTIEELSGCYVSVYGKTVGIIGEPENALNARKAIENLLRGAKHGNVYKWLEARRKEMRRKEVLG